MEIQMMQPVVIIDIETTGLDRENDRIIEICAIKIMKDGEMIRHTKRVNPEMKISPEATEVHGIKDSDLINCPTFQSFAINFHNFIKGCDIVGFGSNSFDIIVLNNEFLRAGIKWEYEQTNFIDVGNIYKIQNPRTLSAAYLAMTGKEHTNAHGAEADAIATLEIFTHQLEHEETPKTMKELAIYSNYGKEMLDISGCFIRNENGEIMLNFGKYKNKLAKDHKDYVLWMLNGGFAPDTKNICETILNN